MQGSTNGRIVVHVSLGIKKDPSSKITNRKRAAGVAQVVEYLPSKCKVWNLTLSTTNSHTHSSKRARVTSVWLLKSDLRRVLQSHLT
jgi:hypothetical protein